MKTFRTRFSIFLIWLTTALTAPVYSSAAQPVIIDHAFETSKHISMLKAQGVRVIGRYYARCVGRGQWSDKRTNREEVEKLLDADFALLSIYQYWNNSEIKFDGLHNIGNEIRPTLDENCAETTIGRSAFEEGRLDGEAAVRQARAVGQPNGTAIYFGVDFSFPYQEPRKIEYTRKMLDYFRTVRRILNNAGYKLGSYGNGYAHSTLLSEGLVDFTWLSPSQAHLGSIEFYRTKQWNLFQYNVDIGWPNDDCSDKDMMGLDVNVQNPEGPADIGFWTRDGPFLIDPKTTRAAFEAMRFICDSEATIRTQSGVATTGKVCRSKKTVRYRAIPHGQFVKVREDDSLVAFDMDGDGSSEGWTKALNLTATPWDRPNWNRTPGRRYCP